MEKDDLHLPAQCAGRVWHYRPDGSRHTPHHHEELEINLVTQGTAAYLLGDRRYELRRHTLVWLFPDQEHALLDQSPDHAMWIGVFTPRLLRQVCTTLSTQTLCAADPDGWYCKAAGRGRRPAPGRAFGGGGWPPRKVTSRLHNAGLGFAALSAWAAYGRAGDGVPRLRRPPRGGAGRAPAARGRTRRRRWTRCPPPWGLSASAPEPPVPPCRRECRWPTFAMPTPGALPEAMGPGATDGGAGSGTGGRATAPTPSSTASSFARLGCSPAAYRRRQS